MSTLMLTHYGKKGIYAYLSKLSMKGAVLHRGPFINGTPEGIENQQRFHQGKSCTVSFDLSALANGFYEYKEASGHKTSFGYLKIQEGEIVEEFDDKPDVIAAMAPIPVLPELQGSERQVSWANQIRSNAIRDGIPASAAIAKTVSARDWIDNRDRIVIWFQEELDHEAH